MKENTNEFEKSQQEAHVRYIASIPHEKITPEVISKAIDSLTIAQIQYVADALAETNPDTVLRIDEVTQSPVQLKSAVERAHKSKSISQKQSVA